MLWHHTDCLKIIPGTYMNLKVFFTFSLFIVMLIRLKFIFYSIYHRLSTVYVLQVFLRPNFEPSSIMKIIFLFRYGTTTYTLPPYKVLHTDLIGSDAIKLKAAVQSEE